MLLRFGKAGWIGSKSDDLSRVSAGAKKYTAPARMFGLAYGWDIEDIFESVFTGTSLPTEEALAARRAYDEFLRFRLLDSELVSDVQSRIVVATTKDSTELPLRED